MGYRLVSFHAEKRLIVPIELLCGSKKAALLSCTTMSIAIGSRGCVVLCDRMDDVERVAAAYSVRRVRETFVIGCVAGTLTKYIENVTLWDYVV